MHGARRGQRRFAAVVVALAALVLAGCTSSATQPPDSTLTHTRTTTHTVEPPGRYHPPKPAFRKPLPPGVAPGKHEKDHSCPYIKTGLNVTDDVGPNMANLEGDRVYRNTILTDLHPVGCRFYFYAPPYAAIAEIQPHTFNTATEAHDAMILTARTGHNLITEENFVRGADGICFQTKFFREDGNQDWAFVFAKGKVMVVVYAFQTNTSRNAFYIGKAIAKKF
jgi:hypothetical protein